MPTLYSAQGGSAASDLYTVDPATGATTSVGPTGHALTGLAFDPSTGTLYGSTSVQSPLHPRSLVTIDKTTGVTTLVGAYGLGSGTSMADLAFDSAGNLYGYGTTGRKLYSINKATGAPTLLGTSAVGSQLGQAMEIDGSANGYLFPNGTAAGAAFYKMNLANAALTVIGHFPGPSIAPLGAASFGPDQAMWVVGTASGVAEALAKVSPSGTVTVIGTMGITNADALAWDGGVKPSDWLAVPDLVEEFDVAPVADAVDCSTPLGALITTDGASQGPSSLKLMPALADSWIRLPPTGAPIATQWVYTSFALYVPSWSELWDSGAAWTPLVLTLRGSDPGHFPDFNIVPTSPTTGVLRYGVGIESTAIPDGAWVAVEVAVLSDNGAGGSDFEFWVNGTDSGVFTDPGAGPALLSIILGDTSWGGPPPTDANMTYYVDDFHWSLSGRIGPVDLSAAFFNGIGTGTDYDACTGTPVSPHPVDDFYTTPSDHTLNVAAPGVMINDILPTTVTVFTGCSHGSIILNTDGSFSYTPNPGFVGTDSFVYSGNGGTATATITVTQTQARGRFDGGPTHKIEQ